MSSESRSQSKTEPAVPYEGDRRRRNNDGNTLPAVNALSDLRTAMRHALIQREKKFFKGLERARSHPTEKAIHDLRVAMRRTIAMLDVVKAILPKSGADRAGKHLDRHLGFFSDLRDTQVQITAIAQLAEEHPMLRELLDDLKSREAVQLKRACKELDRMRLGSLSKSLDEVRRGFDTFLLTPVVQEAALSALHGMLARIFIRTVKLRNEIQESEKGRIETIHELRLRFKRFRYTAEILQPMNPNITSGLLNRMRRYQTMMGAIQDTTVLIAAVESYTKRVDRRRLKRSPLPGDSNKLLHDSLTNRLEKQVRTFLHSINEPDEYWKLIG